MINSKLPLELDDGRAVELVHAYNDGIVVRVRGPIVRPSYDRDLAEADGIDDDTIDEYVDIYRGLEDEDEWYYNRHTGIFDGGNAHGFFVLRNSYSNAEPDETESFFV